jgi:hypothetical protein
MPAAFIHALWHVRIAGKRPPDARHRFRADPPRRDLGVGGMFAGSGTIMMANKPP